MDKRLRGLIRPLGWVAMGSFCLYWALCVFVAMFGPYEME